MCKFVLMCANDALGWWLLVCTEVGLQIRAQMCSCQEKKCTQLNLPTINPLFSQPFFRKAARRYGFIFLLRLDKILVQYL